jgi:hypothetical protein
MIARVIINGIDMSNMSSFSMGSTKGSGNVVEDSRAIDASVINLECRGTVDVKINIAPDAQAGLTVKGDDNLVSMIKTTVKGETLVLDTEGNYSTSNPLVVELSLPSLKSIKNSGTSDISGLLIASPMSITNIQSSGTGSLKLEGLAHHLEIINSGTSDLNLKNVCAQSIGLRNSGTGDVKCWAEKALSIKNSGTGDVKFWGNPESLSKSNSGVGEIEHKKEQLELSAKVLPYANGNVNVNNTASKASVTTQEAKADLQPEKAVSEQAPQSVEQEPASEDEFRRHFKKML